MKQQTTLLSHIGSVIGGVAFSPLQSTSFNYFNTAGRPVGRCDSLIVDCD